MTGLTVLWFLIGVSIGVLVGGALARRVVANNVQSAYDTGYSDGRARRPRRRVQ